MAILDVGENRMAELFESDLYSVVYGTSATAIVLSDTTLGGEDTSVEDTNPVTQVTANVVNITSTIPSTGGNGNTYYETGITLNGGATLFNRAIHAAVVKTSAIELVRITDVTFTR